MNGLHGISFSYEQEPGLRELAERRMPASIPFGGRYRVVDFMLSNLHAAGSTTPTSVMPAACRLESMKSTTR